MISGRRRNGIAAGTAYSEIPGAEYGLTTLLDVMLSLIDWAGAHHDRIRGNQGHCRADKSRPFRWQTAEPGGRRESQGSCDAVSHGRR